eukprot:TRINITY_DN5137_c0_g1_i1.p1 TRINITY_DN5137_c0_g1~~TRINITY_DN5137_c0_g1_i1.p1  ORF type:complete len:530 (-),score=38.13 TRINITY_DN5137_c0_g1_i1:224-1813(-)
MGLIDPRWSILTSFVLCSAYRLRVDNEQLSRETTEKHMLSQVTLKLPGVITLPDMGAFQVTRDFFGDGPSVLELMNLFNSSFHAQSVNTSSGAVHKNADGHDRSLCSYRTLLRKNEPFFFVSILGLACFLRIVTRMTPAIDDSVRGTASSTPLALRFLSTLAVTSSVLLVIRLVTNAFAPSFVVREAVAQEASDAARHAFMFYAEWKKGSLSSHALKEFAAQVDVFSMTLALTTVALVSMNGMWQAVFRLRQISSGRARVSALESCPLLVSTLISIVVHTIALMLLFYWSRFNSVPEPSTSIHVGNAQDDVSAGLESFSHSQPIQDESHQRASVAHSATTCRMQQASSSPPSNPVAFASQQAALPAETYALTQKQRPPLSSPIPVESLADVRAASAEASEAKSDPTVLPRPSSTSSSSVDSWTSRDGVSSERYHSDHPSDAEVVTHVEEGVNLNLRAAIFDLATDFVEDIILLIDGVLIMSGQSPELVDPVCGIILGLCLLSGALVMLPGLTHRWSSLRRCTCNTDTAV